MPLVWDNAPNGVVSVSWDGEHYVTPTLEGHDAAIADRVLATWEKPVAEIIATTRGYQGQPLPLNYALAHIKVESGGFVHAFRRELDKDGRQRTDATGRPLTGVGLLQITDPSLKGSHSDEELFDPALNLKIGLQHLAHLWATGIDLPATTSMWNAGASPQGRPWPSAKSPYGFREYIVFRDDGSIGYDHITAIVRANNYFALRGSGVGFTGDVANAPAGSSSAPPGAIARADKHDPLAGAVLLAGLFAVQVLG